jgi:site-specific recombinase XerD
MKKAKNEAVSVARYIGSFLNDYAPIHMTGSVHTLKSYEIAISLYLTFLEEAKSVTSSALCWEHFGRKWIEDWLEWMKAERGCKPASCNVRLGSLRSFLKYVAEHNSGILHVYQESTMIKKSKTPSRKVEGLTKEAVKVLLEIPDLDTATGRRDLAFMVLLYATATRISEILSLKIADIHLDANKPYITVIGKRDKIRTAYLLPKAAAHIKQYILEFHKKTLDPEAYLFYSRCGGVRSMLTPPAIDKRLKKYAFEAHKICSDVPVGLHPHQFRHAKASHWLEDGINIVQISFLLGHAQLQTTMVYLDVSKEQELKALATLETENDKMISPKWKCADGSLKDFCGLGKHKHKL